MPQLSKTIVPMMDRVLVQRIKAQTVCLFRQQSLAFWILAVTNSMLLTITIIILNCFFLENRLRYLHPREGSGGFERGIRHCRRQGSRHPGKRPFRWNRRTVALSAVE